jgi:hypothetical protein
MLSAETTPSLSRSCGGSLAPVRDNYKNTDTEMAPQLTSVDGHSSPDATPESEIMSSFQSAKDRLDRIKRQQGNGGGFNGDASENWRRSAERADFKMSNHENISHQRSLSDMAGGDIAPIGTVVPGPVWPSPEQLKVAYGYGIRRDDGSYTRLYRADELGGLDVTKIAITQGPEGLITLPPLEVDGHQQFVPRYVCGKYLPSSTRRFTESSIARKPPSPKSAHSPKNSCPPWCCHQRHRQCAGKLDLGLKGMKLITLLSQCH